jgi:hypothetical protein
MFWSNVYVRLEARSRPSGRPGVGKPHYQSRDGKMITIVWRSNSKWGYKRRNYNCFSFFHFIPRICTLQVSLDDDSNFKLHVSVLLINSSLLKPLYILKCNHAPHMPNKPSHALLSIISWRFQVFNLDLELCSNSTCRIVLVCITQHINCFACPKMDQGESNIV